MSNRRKSRAVQEKIQPPNLVPIMNLVTILIPFLLLTVTFVHLAVVDSSLPAITPPKPSSDPGLGLTVAITGDGFVVAGRTAVLGEEATPIQDLGDATERLPTLARSEDGSYPFDQLTDLMVQIKAAHPDDQNVILMPSHDVTYEVVIHTMDATRDHHPDGALRRELLFPFPVIAGGMMK